MGLSILQHEFGNQIPESPDPSCDSQFTVSLGVFILALGATEVVVYLACSLMAWYVNLTFYAQESLEWIHSDPEYRAQGTSLDIIAQSLQISEHKTSEAREPEPELCCPICLVDYEGGEKVAHGNCRHAFHEQCLVQWLKNHPSCPCCRQPIIKTPPAPPRRIPIEVDLHQLYVSHWIAYPGATSSDFLFMF